MIRRWRADLLAKGVSVLMAAKAYRLLRAIMTTAVEEDKNITSNIGAHIEAERGRKDDDDGTAGIGVPVG